MGSHIVALGGGGFGGDENSRMHRYLLDLTGKSDPRVCLIPTASGDDNSVIVGFYRWFAPDRCRRSHLGLFWRDVEDLRGYLLGQELIYVSGGNTANMLAIWRAHGVDRILRQAWEQGVVLCGSSAGSLCWFEAGITDSFGPQLAPLHDGLSFLPGSHCPHYDSEERRRPVYHDCIANGFPAGIAAEDQVGLHYVGTELTEIVASRPSAAAYRVVRSGKGAQETRLPARYLG
jgi:peptidase E